jgi:predicted TIM-barrel fold metal-dependent hydrolase
MQHGGSMSAQRIEQILKKHSDGQLQNLQEFINEWLTDWLANKPTDLLTGFQIDWQTDEIANQLTIDAND